MAVGEMPRWVILCRSIMAQTRSGSGKSGVPSYMNRVAPSMSAPLIAQGPIIQPMSVYQNKMSPGWTSKQWAMSCAPLTGKPQCTCCAPLGLPGGARRVDDHVKLFGVGLHGLALARSGRRPGHATRCRAPAFQGTSRPSLRCTIDLLDSRGRRRQPGRRPLSSRPACPGARSRRTSRAPLRRSRSVARRRMVRHSPRRSG